MLLKAIWSVVVFVVVLASALVLLQDFLIFPALYFPWISTAHKVPEAPPSGVQNSYVTTEDGKLIHVWHVTTDSAPRKGVMLLFHGNGDTLSTFVGVQRLLAAAGYDSYAFDYRGFGRSAGWPSELGMYRDGLAVLDHISAKERIASEEVVLWALSLGTGPASYVAREVQSRTLVMLAPYRSLHAVIDQHPLFWPLRRFSRYRFPTEDYLRELNGTRVVVLHGDQDTVIPVSHSRAMHQALKSEIDLCYIELEGGNHFNMLSGDYAARMLNALSVC